MSYKLSLPNDCFPTLLLYYTSVPTKTINTIWLCILMHEVLPKSTKIITLDDRSVCIYSLSYHFIKDIIISTTKKLQHFLGRLGKMFSLKQFNLRINRAIYFSLLLYYKKIFNILNYELYNKTSLITLKIFTLWEMNTSVSLCEATSFSKC